MKQKKKVVVDTNVIFSAAYNVNSNAGKLILYGIEGRIKLVAPEIARKELKDVLRKKLNYSVKDCEEFIRILPIDWISEDIYAPLLKTANKFIKGADSHFVALAMLVDGILVTGDKEILTIKSKKVKISKLSEFLGKLDTNN